MTTMLTTNSGFWSETLSGSTKPTGNLVNGGFWSEGHSPSTTKPEDRKANEGFWSIYGNLPDSIKGEIFALDDTYKKIMQKEVLVNIWKSRWTRFVDKMEHPLCKLTMEYLLDIWGFNPDSDMFDETNTFHNSWIRENYFPSNVRFVINHNSDFFGNMGVSIKVYNSMPIDSTGIPDYLIFDGWILNESEESKAVLIDNGYFDARKIENVWWDSYGSLFLYKKCW